MTLTETDHGYTVPLKVEVCHVPGPCPFLTCTVSTPHAHPICPLCGAVKFGNLGCELCRVMMKS